DKVRVDGAVGNTAANGIWTIAGVTTNTFQLSGSTGNGAYTGGGVVRRLTGGLLPGQNVGQSFIVIKGAGRGFWAKVASNTKTAIALEGVIPVTLDSTTRYILAESSPIATTPSVAFANANPLTAT